MEAKHAGLAAVALVMVLAACGGGSEEASSGGVGSGLAQIFDAGGVSNSDDPNGTETLIDDCPISSAEGVGDLIEGGLGPYRQFRWFSAPKSRTFECYFGGKEYDAQAGVFVTDDEQGCCGFPSGEITSVEHRSGSASVVSGGQFSYLTWAGDGVLIQVRLEEPLDDLSAKELGVLDLLLDDIIAGGEGEGLGQAMTNAEAWCNDLSSAGTEFDRALAMTEMIRGSDSDRDSAQQLCGNEIAAVSNYAPIDGRMGNVAGSQLLGTPTCASDSVTTTLEVVSPGSLTLGIRALVDDEVVASQLVRNPVNGQEVRFEIPVPPGSTCGTGLAFEIISS